VRLLAVAATAFGVMLLPDMFALAQAPQAFDGHGKLKDPELQERLRKLVLCAQPSGLSPVPLPPYPALPAWGGAR
jgi:hypothetical protein